jgi:predicted dehydrogenase
MNQPVVNIGVIGWGNFFNHIHEQTLRDMLAERLCRLRAVCVRSPQTRADIASRIAVDYGTADYREVLDDPQIDAVIIGAPHSIQAQLSIDSLEAGKWVYVEKPMFADESDTGTDPAAYFDRLERMGDVSRQRLAVGLNKRFAPAYRRVRDSAQTWGGLKTIQMSIVDDAWRWGAKYPPGFLMWLDACHWIDLGRWFTGSEVARISCLSPQVEDSLVTMQMANSAVVSVFLSGNGTMDMMKEELRTTSGARTCAVATDYVQLEVFGGDRRQVEHFAANLQSGGDPAYVKAITEGGLEAFRAIRRQMYDRFLRTQRSPDPEGDAYVKRNLPNFMRPQGWRESLRAFIESVASRRPLENSATFRDAHLAYQLVDVAKQSVAAGGGFVEASGA